MVWHPYCLLLIKKKYRLEKLREIMKDSIAVAKETGLWQRFTLREKEALVRYFYRQFGALRELVELKKTGMPGAGVRLTIKDSGK